MTVTLDTSSIQTDILVFYVCRSVTLAIKRANGGWCVDRGWLTEQKLGPVVPNSCRNQGDSKGSRWWAPSRHHHFAACSRLLHTHEVFCVRSYKIQLRSQCRQNLSLNLGLSELQHWFPDSQNAVLLEFCIGNLWMQKLVLCCCRERTQIATVFFIATTILAQNRKMQHKHQNKIYFNL